MKEKYLNHNLIVDDVSLKDVNSMFYEFFQRKDYEWWNEVEPGDVVVDLGACVGFFTCHALDKGASKIYSIEPSRKHLKTLIRNISDYYIDNGSCPVVPIHAGIGKDSRYSMNIFNDVNEKPEMLSFKELIERYNIDHIDYLKIDCEGGEYDVFNEENIDFLINNVKKISVEFHVDCFREAPYEWLNFRNNLCYKFGLEKIHFLREEDHALAHNDQLLTGNWPIGWGASWMVYITNN